MTRVANLASFFVALLICLELTAHDNWNQFRGPGGNGIYANSDLPIEFDESKNVRWKTLISDSGWSSPVIWEHEIWVTSGSDEKKELRVICIDLNTGIIKHNIKVFDMIKREVDPAYIYDSPHLNSPATPTPVIDEKHVFVSFGSQGIACLNRKTGEQVWQRRDLRIYQPVRQGSSPIVDDKRLYVAFDGTDKQFFIALDKTTGKTDWKTNRETNTDWKQTLRQRGISSDKGGKPNDNKKSFATATIIEVHGKRQLIAPGAEAIISYNPDTGEELWRTVHPGGFNVAARPIYANGLVYVFTSGLNNILMAIRPDGTGDVSDTHVVWSTMKSTPSIPSPVIVNDLLFMVTDRGGIVRCLNANSGIELWKGRLGGDHWASPVYTNGKLYFSSKQGEVSVIESSRQELQVISRNRLNAMFIASPAISNSSLILRSTTHLYCLANGYRRTQKQIAADVYPSAEKNTDSNANTRPNAADAKKTAGQPMKNASRTDWDAAYEKLMSDPAIRQKIKSSGATKEQIIEFLKKKAAADTTDQQENTPNK